MTTYDEFGTSVLGYQELALLPSGITRAFLDVIDVSHTDPQLWGTFLVGQAFEGSYDVPYVWEARKVWGKGTLVTPIPPIPSIYTLQWRFAMQWRRAGLRWHLFVDDAT